MGFYINPKTETKESFLNREGKQHFFSNGIKSCPEDFWNSDVPDNCLPVVLLDNRAFTAAGICFCLDEFKQFINPNDNRRKALFVVEINKLYEVSDLPKDIKSKPKV